MDYSMKIVFSIIAVRFHEVRISWNSICYCVICTRVENSNMILKLYEIEFVDARKEQIIMQSYKQHLKIYIPENSKFTCLFPHYSSFIHTFHHTSKRYRQTKTFPLFYKHRFCIRTRNGRLTTTLTSILAIKAEYRRAYRQHINSLAIIARFNVKSLAEQPSRVLRTSERPVGLSRGSRNGRPHPIRFLKQTRSVIRGRQRRFMVVNQPLCNL